MLANYPGVELIRCCDDIQLDDFSCSIFALDHVFHMSKMTDLHDVLDKAKKRPSDEEKLPANWFMVNAIDLPSVLVKNAQSLTYINKSSEKNK